MKRYLCGNKTTEGPSNLIFFDTESFSHRRDDDPESRYLTLRCWCASKLRLEKGKRTRRISAQGEDAESFWRFVSENSTRHRSTWIFAHNMAFDLTQVDFWRRLGDGKFTIAPLYCQKPDKQGKPRVSWRGRIVAERQPFYIICRDDKRTYRFIDTYNYWPKGLRKIAKTLGMDKLKMPAWDAPLSHWLEYCWQDVHIIEEAVCELIETWTAEDCGVFQPTAASLAMSNFRHWCNVRTKDGDAVDILCDPGAATHSLEREAYYGGRFQCFYVGTVKQKVWHFDVNSLYPYVMMNNSYPRRLAGEAEEMTHGELESKIGVYDCCARVLIRSTGATFPVRVGRIQYHAYGNYFTTLCGPELLRALESNSIARIHRVQWYSRAPLFREWVQFWYQRKLSTSHPSNGRASGYEFSKLILNSLSGKFAQHGRYWIDLPNRFPVEAWGGWTEDLPETRKRERLRGLGRSSQYLGSESEPIHSFPIISAMITAYAREYMREVIATLPEFSVYYMATDSILCDQYAANALHAQGLIDADKIGHFKLKGVADELTIRCANDYQFGTDHVIAGLMGKAHIDERRDGKVEVWEGMPGLITGGPKNSVRVTTVPVAYRAPEFKGYINPNGWWEPHCLIDSEDWRTGPPPDGYHPAYFSDKRVDRTPLIV